MKLKMLCRHTYKNFYNIDLLKSFGGHVCILRYQTAENYNETSGFYFGEKNDHEFDNLNAPLKRLL